MNKPLSTEELKASVAIIPMSRRDKLMRFADVVRRSERPFFIFHGLEYYHPSQLGGCYHPASAFSAAASDPILKDAGLKGDTALDAMQFFDLAQSELHEFSCDCGGVISNEEMAKRIERLAQGPAPRETVTVRVSGTRFFGLGRAR